MTLDTGTLGVRHTVGEALCEIASEDFKFIRSLKGKNKKCLVLDCDNVLWGGIIGEDGLSGIKLSKTYPGSPYYEFQQEVMNFSQPRNFDCPLQQK